MVAAVVPTRTPPARARVRADEPHAPTYTIGELAREFGLTTRAIRFYEASGLVAPGRRGSRRVYSARDRARLTLTLRGKRLGLKLSQVKELIDLYDTRRDSEAQLRRVIAVLASQRSQLEDRLAELQVTLAEVVAQQVAAKRLLKHGAFKA